MGGRDRCILAGTRSLRTASIIREDYDAAHQDLELGRGARANQSPITGRHDFQLDPAQDDTVPAAERTIMRNAKGRKCRGLHSNIRGLPPSLVPARVPSWPTS